jgi:sugar phosphate isomerase/epimerase
MGAVGAASLRHPREERMMLGLATHSLAKDWDLTTIIQRCAATGFRGVELQTTHRHGVEACLDVAGRRRVREVFAESPVALVSLGTEFEYHAIDPADVRRNVEGTKAHVILAHDVGAAGVKVRPNGHQEAAGIPRERTLEQIGLALRECGRFAADYGVEIRLVMSGAVAEARDIRQIVLVADHPAVGVCWNSNKVDVKAGSVRADFELVREWIRLVHITELWSQDYPYRELFGLLKGTG